MSVPFPFPFTSFRSSSSTIIFPFRPRSPNSLSYSLCLSLFPVSLFLAPALSFHHSLTLAFSFSLTLPSASRNQDNKEEGDKEDVDHEGAPEIEELVSNFLKVGYDDLHSPRCCPHIIWFSVVFTVYGFLLCGVTPLMRFGSFWVIYFVSFLVMLSFVCCTCISCCCLHVHVHKHLLLCGNDTVKGASFSQVCIPIFLISVSSLLSLPLHQPLSLLQDSQLAQAVKTFVEKNEPHAIEE